MFMDFDKIFHPELRWENRKLTDACPCRVCDIYKNYETKALYGSIAERQYAALPESCEFCMAKINWQTDCMTKFRWYEDHDKRLR